MDIVGQNRVTGERDIEIQTAEVTGIAFSKNGLWLGTVEQRLITDLDKEIKLKFWFYNKVDQKYHKKTNNLTTFLITLSLIFLQVPLEDCDRLPAH